MKALPTSLVDDQHSDYPVLSELKAEIVRRAGGEKALTEDFPALIRRAIDEVIDTPRTGRLFLSETEKTEKTYIGTKIEILFRDYLNLPKGRLDLKIKGRDVDIKNTVMSNWMIPREAINHPCILLAADEQKFECFLGIIVARPDYLRSGTNQDGKRSISAKGFSHIYWLLKNHAYPKNFWATIDEDIAKSITNTTGTSGTERLYKLFKLVKGKPISRDVVESVPRQKDYMKRLRKNGGARDRLLAEHIAVLSGMYHSEAIATLGLPACEKHEFISVDVDDDAKRSILARYGYN